MAAQLSIFFAYNMITPKRSHYLRKFITFIYVTPAKLPVVVLCTYFINIGY